jgi:hypothetical protein
MVFPCELLKSKFHVLATRFYGFSGLGDFFEITQGRSSIPEIIYSYVFCLLIL